jgi:hypothetical protein
VNAGSSNPIPSGISSACTTYLQNLNTNTQLASCTAPLLKATNAFSPNANSTSQTQTKLVSTLDTLCAASGCSDTFVHSLLTNFYAACKADLTSNTSLKDTYDILYIMNPLSNALCCKDGDTYCVIKAAQTMSSSDNAAGTDTGDDSTTQNADVVTPQTDAEALKAAVDAFNQDGNTVSGIGKRGTSGQSTLKYAPNTQTYRDNGVPYL